MKKTRWANILCHEDMSPYKLIVSDGDFTTELPITNTSLKAIKRVAYEVYDVKPANILVSQIFDHDTKTS